MLYTVILVLEGLLEELLGPGASPVGILGGLADAIRPFMPDEFRPLAELTALALVVIAGIIVILWIWKILRSLVVLAICIAVFAFVIFV